MPLNFIGAVISEGTDVIPYWSQIKKYGPYFLGASALKYWARGGSNIWERNLHGRVYILTGATSQGMGTSVALDLANKGAQLIILTRTLDEWSTDWCNDLRERSGNSLIYMEQCDLSDLLSVRKFATKWLDNSPPRRLDGVIAMSGEMEPWFRNERKSSIDGLELQIATNYAGIFHLLDLLQPSFKAQPPDRDVRIVITTCWWQSMGRINIEDPLWQDQRFDGSLKYFATSKLQLGLTCCELQRRLMRAMVADEKKEHNVASEKGANVSITLVQPGMMRSNSLRRVISNGSVILLLALYCVLLYPLLWVFFKSGRRGAENILYAVMTPELEAINRKDLEEVLYVVDCEKSKLVRKEYQNEEIQKKLYDKTAKDILELEKIMAKKRPINKDKKKEDKTSAKTSKAKPSSNTTTTAKTPSTSSSKTKTKSSLKSKKSK